MTRRTEEPELAGMPERHVREEIHYTLTRDRMVIPSERLDVGAVIQDLVPRHFEVRRVIHTKSDGIDVYQLKATEIT